MLKAKAILAIVCSLGVVGGGSYYGYKEYVKADSKEQSVASVKTKQAKEEISNKNSVKDLTKEEAEEVLKSNIDSIFDTFDKAAEENNWNEANPVNFGKVELEIEKYATKNFANGKLKGTLENSFKNMDSSAKPNYNSDIRFESELNKDGKTLKINTIQSPSDIDNMGYQWSFELVKQDGKWKMNDWDQTSLDKLNVQFTKEEAQKSVLISDGQTLKFVKEYNSDQADGKAYLFQIKENDSYIAVSSKDLSKVTDYEVKSELNTNNDSTDNSDTTEKKANTESGQDETTSNTESNNDSKSETKKEEPNNTSKSNSNETSNQTIDDNVNLNKEFYTKLHFGENKDTLVKEFGSPSAITETSQGTTLKYEDSIYTLSNGEVSKVEIIGEKASRLYHNFDEVMKEYFPDPVYAEYEDKRSHDSEGYKLVLDDGYSKKHTFISGNKNGDPIKKIIIEMYSPQ
ncbi:hypothetical protein AAGG74_16535 [Bacillus mexicanus]|uniref:hypothetical protein n=1 Tax=Bacillus mexicanus TaxID=2834415 RepID=UPI003D1E7B6F